MSIKSITGWIVAVVFAAALGWTLLSQTKMTREKHAAEAAREQAEKAQKTALDAANIAIAARQKVESERAEVEAQTKRLSSDFKVAQLKESEAQSRAAGLEREAANTRRILAEQQTGNTGLASAQPAAAAAPAPIPTPKHAAPTWSVSDMLPPETLAVVTVRDLPTTITKAKDTGLYKILSDEELLRVFRLPLARAQGAVMFAEMQLQEKLATVLEYFQQGEITLAVISLDGHMADGKPLPDVLLSIQMGDKAKAFTDEFNKRQDELKALLGGNLQIDTQTLGATTITRFSHQNVPFKISTAMCDNTFLVCVGEGRIEKLLAMREKRRGLKPGDAPPVKDAEVLAEVETYRRAVERAGSDADVLIFANTVAIGKLPPVANRDMNPTQRHEWEMSGLSEVRAVSYSVGVKGDGLRESIFLDVPADKRLGVLGVIDGESADLTALYNAPRSALAAAIFKVTPDKLLNRVVELAALENPQIREQAAQGLFFIAEQLKLDVKRDILGAFTGQGIFSLSVPGKNPKLPAAFPQPILALQIQNLAGVKNLIQALTTAAQDKAEFKDVTLDGATITQVRERVPENPDEPKQFCFAIKDQELLLSLYPLALRDELKRRGTAGARLQDDPAFNRARAALSGQPQAMLYLDEGAILTALYDVLMPIAQFRSREAQVDLTVLPTADLLARNLNSALLDLHFAPDGVFIETQSSTGIAALLLPLGAAVAGKRNAAMEENMQAQVAEAAPAAKARTRGAGGTPKLDPQRKELLGKFFADLKSYVTENNGAYPKSLDEMKPKYLQELGKELSNIVYRGKQAADNQVIAYTSEKLPGSIAVLLQNGTIEGVLRPFLGEVLRNGFIDPKQPVKPPKPPEF